MLLMHGSVSLWQLVLVVIWLAAIHAAAVDLHHLEVILGASVRDCLRRSGITEEQAADLMRMSLSAFRKCLRGEGHLQLGLARLMRLGIVFMSYLAPVLLYHAARLHAEQVKEDALEAAKALVGRKVL